MRFCSRLYVAGDSSVVSSRRNSLRYVGCVVEQMIVVNRYIELKGVDAGSVCELSELQRVADGLLQWQCVVLVICFA